MGKPKSEPKTITMYPEDWETVSQFAQTSGVKTLSAAMRIILQEWRRVQLVNSLRKLDEVENVTAN